MLPLLLLLLVVPLIGPRLADVLRALVLAPFLGPRVLGALGLVLVGLLPPRVLLSPMPLG